MTTRTTTEALDAAGQDRPELRKMIEEIVESGFVGVGASSVLSEAERQWLTQRIRQLRAQYREPTNQRPLHGDAWQSHVAVTAPGETILLDLEHVSVGRHSPSTNNRHSSTNTVDSIVP